MDKSVQDTLMREDAREEKELRSYVAQSLTRDMINSMPGAINPTRGDEVKTPAERPQDASVQWSNENTMDHRSHR